MIRIAFILRELFWNIRRNPGAALGSFLSLMLLLLLFDIFWIAAQTSDRFYDKILSEIRLEVFLPEQLSDSAVFRMTTEVTVLQGIRATTLIDKQTARLELASLVGTDLLIGYDSLNPLPQSIRIELEPELLNRTAIEQLSQKLSDITGSNDILYSRNWLEKAEQMRTIILRVGLALGGIILLTALVTTTNSIRLMAAGRRASFRQMLLLGSGRMFVAFPFLLEGFLISGAAAVSGWMAILYVQQRIEFTQFEIVQPLSDHIVLYCLAAAALGGISGLVGTRRRRHER